MPALLNDLQTQKFRPGLDTWLGRVVLPLVFLLVLAFTAINLLKAHPGFMWLALTLILTIGMAASVYAIPVIFGQIRVGRSGLWANIDGIRLDVLWKDIRALQVSVQNSEPYLIIGVGAGIFVVPLRQFDVKAIWGAIRQNGPQEAMRPEAFDAYTRHGADEGIPPDLWMVGSLRVADSRGLVFASGAGTIGFIGLFAVSIVVGLPGAMVFLAFSILYLLALLNIGYTELDLRGITRRTVFGTAHIYWDELSAVVMGPFGLRIALEGMRGQRLVLFGPPVWTGADAARAVHFLALADQHPPAAVAALVVGIVSSFTKHSCRWGSMKTLAPVEFRATTRAWIGELALPLVFMSLLALTAVRSGLDPLLAAVCLGASISFSLAGTLAPMLRTVVLFDRTTLEGMLNGRPFRMFYSEILAAWQMQRRRGSFLCLGTRKGTLFIPLLYLDDSAVWNEVVLRVDSQALRPEAIESLPDYQDWARARQATLMRDLVAPRGVTDHWSLQLLGWGGLSLSVYTVIVSWSALGLRDLLVYGLICLISLAVLLRWGVTYVSIEAVRRVTLTSSQHMSWNDVRQVETDPFGLVFVLRSDRCKMVIPGPVLWSPAGRMTVLRLFHAQVKARDIPIQHTLKAMFGL